MSTQYDKGKQVYEFFLRRDLTPQEELTFKRIIDELHIESGALARAIGFFYGAFVVINNMPQKITALLDKTQTQVQDITSAAEKEIKRTAADTQAQLEKDASALHESAKSIKSLTSRLIFWMGCIAVGTMIFCAGFCWLFYKLGEEAGAKTAPSLSPDATTFFQSKSGQEVFDWYKAGRLDDVVSIMTSPAGDAIDLFLLKPETAKELQQILTCTKQNWEKENTDSGVVCKPSGTFTLPR